MDYRPLALIPALLPGTAVIFTEKNNRVLLKGTRWREAAGQSRAVPGRAYLRATAASHCSQGGRAHEASARLQRGSVPDRRGGGSRRRPSPGAIPEAEPGAKTCPGGQCERSGPVWSVSSSGYGTERGLTAEDLSTSWWAVRCSGHSSHCACAIRE